MFELMIMSAFTIILLGCVAAGQSVIWALAAGYLIFCYYGIRKGHSVKALLKMSAEGLKQVKNVLIIMCMIGALTALWRAAGTIPVIICYASKVIHPSIFLLLAFLLNCLVSVLTGTSFGTSATMGVICMSMGNAMGINPLYLGGAIMSGLFFGDRCSPVSSSAALVAEITKTNIYDNIRLMIKTSMVPFLAVCAVYLGLGFFSGNGNAVADVEAMFSGSFQLTFLAVIPAVLILALSLFRLNVKLTMSASIFAALVLCIGLQDMSGAEVVRTIISGYKAKDAALAPMMNGGGILSMVSVVIIVGLSSFYSGIFDGTGLLISMKQYVAALGRKITPFGGIAAVSAVTSMISCNQTLATMLTYQIAGELEPDSQRMAIHLENTVILLAPLVPWSIAGAVPISTIGAPMACLWFSLYLYLVPAWNFLVEARRGGNHEKKAA